MQQSSAVSPVGIAVTFEYAGAAHYSPRKFMPGVVTDVRTLKSGEREYLVVAEGINLPKWVKAEAIVHVYGTASAAVETPAPAA